MPKLCIVGLGTAMVVLEVETIDALPVRGCKRWQMRPTRGCLALLRLSSDTTASQQLRRDLTGIGKSDEWIVCEFDNSEL